ncbi:FixH family protein [Sphingomonas sp. KC8]|uniref:FixH family protein n=1 Tax=Sphingomonas sp. KC8 TaxID=1030157 RepID=UPI00024897B6|nr:FixH family protein [Sphingomonas sp. KC8]ARS28911.1 nitrogen fixation protein FixH [Sphingomonas sp. KC8]
MTRPFTGRHMGIAMVAFFGVIISVNLLMATLATRSFGGLIVANGYVASRQYNGWLEAARTQDALGWTAAVARADGGVELIATAEGAALDGAAVTATASHPLGRLPARSLRFRAIGQGRYQSIEPLPAGRWRVHATLRKGGNDFRMVGDIAA